MSFDLEKLQAVAELGDVIRLHNEALDRLQAFRKARPYMVMPNLMKMVEENLKENLQVLYKEFNNLHKPAEEQTRYICNECKMAFVVKLPGGICDECRARLATKPRDYVLHPITPEEDEVSPEESEMAVAAGEGEAAADEANEAIAADVENAAAGDKQPVDVDEVVATETEAPTAEPAVDDMTDDFQKFMAMAGGGNTQGNEAAPKSENVADGSAIPGNADTGDEQVDSQESKETAAGDDKR